jgi:hypothetical protein
VAYSARKQGAVKVKKQRPLVEIFTELMDPYGTPPAFFQEFREVLHKAAKRAGWLPPSAKAQLRQHAAARGRIKQREEDLAIRRVFVAIFFKQLRPGLRNKPGSLGTAQAILGRLDEMKLERKPPMTVRTIQADIKFLKENGNFGI